jgi:transcriptional regulator GlxA family with amidase domain
VFRRIDFEGESAPQLWGALRDRFGPVLDLGVEGGAGRALGRLIDDVADRKSSGLQVQAEAAHSAFLGCWFQMESLEAGHSNPAAILRESIRENYQHNVNIKQLCAEVGQSREHLTRVFKKTYGIEPAAYLRHLRLNAAERFLLRSNLSIREIALRTGHAGPAHFTRSFIAANGKSPRAFRNR